jgi:malonate transporter and related proteins
MPTNLLLMLPDFALILIGALMARRFAYERGFWEGTERLVYYVLFPPLLFNAIVTAEFSFASDMLVLAAAVGSFLAAVALAYLAVPLFKPRPEIFAGCVQTAFRYNSYVGLALAQALYGARGVALLALIVSVCIPLANFFAVYALARHRRVNLLRELAINPLILGTVSGLLANLAGIELPVAAANLLSRLGGAAIAIGLLCIGAGLTFASVRDDRRTLTYFSVIKLVVVPAIALALIYAFGLRGVEAQVVILFAALPTASSAYILAARMGAPAAPVAALITVQTLVAMATLPLWVSVAPT